MSEERRGIVRAKLGFCDYDLFFTDKRILCAKTGSTGGWNALFGVIGQGIATHMSNKRSEQLEELTLKSIETSDKKNYSLTYEGILRAQLMPKGALSTGKLIINDGTKEFKFIFRDKKKYEENCDIILACLEEKIQN
ncbi:hypothetical protein CHISP_0923 [Chitinispirillum alkaliphilum]|nr:hypothetical protein CHISP_0923 [Chitinispirillum alkaliphilum]